MTYEVDRASSSSKPASQRWAVQRLGVRLSEVVSVWPLFGSESRRGTLSSRPEGTTRHCHRRTGQKLGQLAEYLGDS